MRAPTVLLGCSLAWLALAAPPARAQEAALLVTLSFEDDVRAVVVTPAGDQAVLGSDDLLVWVALEDGAERRRLAIEGDVQDLAFSPDGARLAVATSDAGLLLLDAATGEVAWRATGHQHPRHERRRGARSLAFLPDGRLASIGNREPLIRLWAAADGRPAGTLDPALGEEPTWLAAGGACLAVSGEDGAVAALALPDGAPRWKMSFGGGAAPLAFSPDGVRLAVGRAGHGTSSAVLVRASDGEQVGSLSPCGDRPLAGVAWTPSGDALVTAARGTGIAPVLLWRLGEGDPSRTALDPDHDAEEDGGHPVAVGLGGRRAVVSGSGHQVRIYRLP